MRDAVQGGTAWHKDVGSSPSRERGAEREFGELWGAGKGTRLLCEGREPKYAKSHLCFQREGNGPRTISLATKCKNQTDNSPVGKEVQSIGGRQFLI